MQRSATAYAEGAVALEGVLQSGYLKERWSYLTNPLPKVKTKKTNKRGLKTKNKKKKYNGLDHVNKNKDSIVDMNKDTYRKEMKLYHT